ncbi:MAG: carotenoid oxygenase family protein [Gloeomargarita sp. SKYBB_i_bin120]|nr:carotenoid oxygenase family protein [Gloeomargarita sp. SKYG98]MCS7291424.1 carotenoid oxygenase family protein [Gloeomargarita sp. SKYB120]MDW8176984.1 carotenoid oxygenase family protein [Gloeomargarita sp. SKYBB_i_bin120]
MATAPSYPWQAGILTPAVEFGPEPLTVLEGRVPLELRGTFYRNGPGRLTRGNQRVGHWFDGDGAILAVHFANGTATGLLRYVQTAGYQAEERAGRYLLANYGMTAPGSLWDRLFGKNVKNCANTSVLPLPDRLLALWEGGPPHQLDRQSLQTLGLDLLGSLTPTSPYSAHPKRDPTSGEIYNFGVSLGWHATLHLYRSDRYGRIQKRAQVPLEGFPLIHDFALAGPYLVFFIPPVRLNLTPLILNQKSYSEALEWQPHLGTQILIIDRENFQVVTRAQAPPWFQWHLANGCVVDERWVRVQLVRYADFATNEYLRELTTGHPVTPAPSHLWEMELALPTGRLERATPLTDQNCEFPVVAEAVVGQPWRYTYCSMKRPGADVVTEIDSVIGCYDQHTQTWQQFDCGVGYYCMEPVHASTEAGDYLLSLIFNSNNQQSELWIFPALSLTNGPCCRLQLPYIVPFGFHGKWAKG